jgi:hypothetical protein
MGIGGDAIGRPMSPLEMVEQARLAEADGFPAASMRRVLAGAGSDRSPGYSSGRASCPLPVNPVHQPAEHMREYLCVLGPLPREGRVIYRVPSTRSMEDSRPISIVLSTR